MKKTFYFFLFVLISHCYAQTHQKWAFENPVSRFTMDEYGNSYIVYKNYLDCIRIVKTDPANNIIWSKKFCGIPVVVGSGIKTEIAVQYGKIYFAYSYITDHYRSAIMQLDTNGNLVWHKACTNAAGGPVKIFITPQKVTVVLAGLRILNYDHDGTLNYQVAIDKGGQVRDAVMTNTGNIMIVGRNESVFGYVCSVQMLNGNVNWFYSYEPSALTPYNNMYVNAIEQLSPDHFIIGGEMLSLEEGDIGFFSVIDSSGNILRNRKFVNNEVKKIIDINKLGDGKLYLDMFITGYYTQGYAVMDTAQLNPISSYIIDNPDYCLTPVSAGAFNFTEDEYNMFHLYNDKYYYKHQCKFFIADQVYNNCTDYVLFPLKAVDTIFNFTINSTYGYMPAVSFTDMYVFLYDDVQPPVLECSDNLGIAENISLAISMMPNPADHYVMLSSGTSMGIIELKDIQGKTVLIDQANTGNVRYMDISMLSPGLYIISVQTNYGMISKKLMVAH